VFPLKVRDVLPSDTSTEGWRRVIERVNQLNEPNYFGHTLLLIQMVRTTEKADLIKLLQKPRSHLDVLIKEKRNPVLATILETQIIE
jgi:hypothetical protein